MMRPLRIVLAFVRAELVGLVRQPRLLLMLVLGPFLVLLVFGMGYDESLPTLSTLVVGRSDDELVEQVDAFVREEEPAGIDYRGTTDNAQDALAQLRDGAVDLVVVLPERPRDSLGRDERAVIEVHQASLDPVTYSQVAIAADSAVAQINDRVVELVLSDLQERTSGFGDDLREVRQQLADFRAAVSDDDLALAQRRAAQLATRLEQLAGTLEAGVPFADFLGLTGRSDQIRQDLLDTARQLEQVAALDAPAALQETSAALEELDVALAELQAVDAAVAVRPFEADVLSATPVPVTLDRYYAPGLVALMLQHVALTFTALGLVRERRQRTAELLAATPATLGQRLAGSGVAHLLLGAVAAAGLVALIVMAFGVPLPTNWGAFVLLVALTLVASIGYGLVVAAISDTESQAVQYSMLAFLVAIFFTGLFLPLDRIGQPAELVTWLTPATYAFAGMQELLLLQRPATWILPTGLAILGVMTVSIGILTMRARRLWRP